MERKRREIWFNLRFSLGCASKSSIAVATPTSAIIKKTNYSIGFRLPKPKISFGIGRLIKSLTSVTQIFAYRDEIEDKEEDEMEIGNPTDVKHLTHIGWDGSTTIPNNPNSSFPAVTLKQFEIAMEAQAQAFSDFQLLVHSSNS